MVYSISKAVLRALSKLPLSVLYAVSTVLWPILYYVIRHMRKVTRRNLARSFPEKTLKEIRQIEHMTYRHMCDIGVEMLKMMTISKEELCRRVTINGLDKIETAADEGRPVFVLLAHYGNWEWIVATFGEKIKKPSVSRIIYAPHKNKKINQLILDLRNSDMSLMIDRDKAAREILSLKSKYDSFVVGFNSDQRPPRRSGCFWTTFLNQDTPCFEGAERLGRHVDAVYLYAHVEQMQRGYYTVTVENLSPTEDQDYPYMTAYMQRLEKDIKDVPHLWIWAYKRWKRKRSDYQQ